MIKCQCTCILERYKSDMLFPTVLLQCMSHSALTDTLFLCACSSNDLLPADGSDGCGQGKACPGVKNIPQDGLNIPIPCKLFCVKEMAFHYLNLDKYLIIFS